MGKPQATSKSSFPQSLAIALFTLGAIGLGLGGGITVAFWGNRRLPVRTSVPTVVLGDQACELTGLDPLTHSLQQVKTVNAIAYDPLPTVSGLWELANRPEVWARLNPAPFPNIAPAAREARVPIVMYHDITPVKDVSWDVTPAEFAEHLRLIQAEGMTPISLERLVNHLRTGAPLPDKPIVLTFDDNYLGQYKYAFPLLKKYGYPAVWSVHTAHVGSPAGKPKATWEQLREMQQSGLIEIASHTVNHIPFDRLTPDQIRTELVESKRVLEQNLGVPVRYFTYAEGIHDAVSKRLVAEAGYEAALTMSLDPYLERTANESEDLLAISRYGQSRFAELPKIAWGGPQTALSLLPSTSRRPIDFTAPVRKRTLTIDGLPLTLVSGGQVTTAHSHTRSQVEEVAAEYIKEAIAVVDGAFFSLESLTSNKMLGPVLSRHSRQAGVFNPGNLGENPLLQGRPLVLIAPDNVRFVPFDAKRHRTLEAIQAELPGVTDAFVGAAWLVRDGQPQPATSFGRLYGFDAHRDRAFWGIDREGRPTIGVTMEMIDSVGLGKILAKAGLHDVVMLDSGASAALAYRGESVMAYEPRPVPHVVALLPPLPPSLPKTPLACGATAQNQNP
ncbi:MAG TPA: polysaccharide deacetylase [Cyanobacteria bacterium UBA8156]|jgi:peptidoglycan/xylan/chitin deacetylase (PgdA/CDA1 family)|nr:polysaccharide deacetylase [Cyanobacteria bacterium UBA8156]